jgi:hypothetical protein
MTYVQHLKYVSFFSYYYTFTFIADEEIGGMDGMMKFVNSQDFKNLNVGFGLDEGRANITDEFHILYGEKYIWRKCGPFVIQFRIV